jgi:uncharacterized membrane protein
MIMMPPSETESTGKLVKFRLEPISVRANKDFLGGATSAGVLNGLQAVLMFLILSMVLCGRIGGSEICRTHTKLFSLIVVVFGILLCGKAKTTKAEKESKWKDGSNVNGVENNHSVNVV